MAGEPRGAEGSRGCRGRQPWQSRRGRAAVGRAERVVGRARGCRGSAEGAVAGGSPGLTSELGTAP